MYSFCCAFMFIIMSNACHCFMLCFNYMLLIVGQKLLKACVVLLLTCRLKINIYLSIYLSKSEEIRKRPNLLKFTYIFSVDIHGALQTERKLELFSKRKHYPCLHYPSAVASQCARRIPTPFFSLEELLALDSVRLS